MWTHARTGKSGKYSSILLDQKPQKYDFNNNFVLLDDFDGLCYITYTMMSIIFVM